MPSNSYSTALIPTTGMGETIYTMKQMVQSRRTSFERRWYDNNFFDDGFHYRFYSRAANKIIDLSDRATLYNPMRAIPKASRQIRGVANLLVSPDFVPVIYPEKPETPQFDRDDSSAHESEDRAHKVSRWMTKEWEAQELVEKLAFMAILAAKHGVSWVQVWPDAVAETIKTQVYDAFDIYVLGEYTEVKELPFIIKSTPKLISEIKANENFDPDQLAKISPDNRFASSDIKEAYMSARYNKMGNADSVATIVQNEGLVKEYLNKSNYENIKKQDDGPQILKGKKEGDPVIRQIFTGGNIWLRDRYVDMDDYNFVDFRFEPGPIYQVPLIERFIPVNKSLDLLVSRAERYSHTMVTGKFLKQKGQDFTLTNDAGGQTIEYIGTPPTEMPIAPIPQFFFELMALMGSLIEEQGVTTSTLGKLPTGVKANAAIESLKESEFANLVVATRRLKNTVKRIAEKMLDIADVHYITPKTVYDMENGKPSYFDVIGNTAMQGRRKLKVDTEPLDAIPLKKDYKVEIEVQTGMAYTQEGKKAAAKELGEFMVQMAQLQLLNPDVVKKFVQQLFQIYKFGPTEDIMESLNSPDLTNQLSEEQLNQLKVAVLETLKDAQMVGPQASEQRITENKIGVIEALKESGLAQNMGGQAKESISINYKDAPEDIKRQMEQEAGFDPSRGLSPAGSDQIVKHQQAELNEHTTMNPPKEKGGQNATKKAKK